MELHSEHLWRDPGGVWHRVRVTDLSTKMATIEYWDNTRRGVTYRTGRRYNHGTRARVVVWQTELRPIPQGKS